MTESTHHRRSIRLPEYDYTLPGAYFVTICTYKRAHLFGQVIDGGMQLSRYGQIAHACWEEIPAHFPHVELDAFVVMPNHIHGIIVVGARHAVPLQQPQTEQFGKPVPGSVPTIVRSFKSAVTKRINAIRGTPGARVWQRNYWEHVIRHERALNAIRQYILANPIRWHLDRYNAEAVGPDPKAKEVWDIMRR